MAQRNSARSPDPRSIAWTGCDEEVLTVLGCVAGYFDGFASRETEELNGKLDTAVILEFGLGDIGIRHGWILSNGGVAIAGEISERLPGSWQVAFALVEIKSLGGCGARFGDPADCGENVGEIE